jgi:hypothetical protein
LGWDGVNEVGYAADEAALGGRLAAATFHRVVDHEDRIGVVMILPQVHLRKPCYDLFFL